MLMAVGGKRELVTIHALYKIRGRVKERLFYFIFKTISLKTETGLRHCKLFHPCKWVPNDKIGKN